MNDITRIATNLIIISMVLIILGTAINSYIENHYGYEYITVNDEVGISTQCIMNDKGLFCKTKDGLVDVRQFRKR